MGIELTKEQLEAVESSGGQTLVSAAAGSGKTRVLVERLMRRVEAGADVDEFLIITYTNAAAAELRGKILDALMDRVAQDPANTRLRREAGLAGRAKIGTIHSFCASVIRENAHRLRLPPDFRVADEAEAAILRADALEETLEELFDRGEPGFLELADTMGAGRDDRRLGEVLLETHEKLLSHPSPAAWMEAQKRALDLPEGTDAGATPWGRVIMERAGDQAAYWREQFEYLMDEAAADPKVEKGYGESFRATYASLRAFERALEGSWDEARAAANIDFPTGRLSGYDDLKAVRTSCREAMKKLGELFWDDSARALADMRAVAPELRALFDAVLLFDKHYSEAKRHRGVLDFADQEHLALELLTDPATGAPTDIAREVAGRFREIMVDEYQDVNAIQEAILTAVSREGRNLFAVGDVKQSIYRFRLADPTIFLRKYRSFKDAGDAAEGEPRRVVLSRNFRSREGILEAVNFVFANTMSEKLGELSYTEREYLYPGAAFPESAEPQVELDVLDLKPGEGEEDDDIDRAVAEAAFAAGRVRELLKCGTVADGEGTRPVRYGDIAVLMRSPRNEFPKWRQVFARFGIPLTSEQSSNFFAEEEVSLVLSILDLIDNPRQDIPLITALKCPVWGFTAQELGEIRANCREGDFWTALSRSAEGTEKSRRFIEELAGYRRATADMTADELLWHLYRATGLLGVVSAMDGGERRRQNLMLLMEVARQCEGSGYKGLFGFMTWVRRLREQGKGPEGFTRAAENAVTVMSIHKSKGLEFPVVILAGLTKQFNTVDTRARLLIHPDLGPGPIRTDTERKIEYDTLARRAVAEKLRGELLSEELRVLYVAMTRAREKLIMVASYTDAARELTRMRNTPLPAPAEVLLGAKSMADWILIPALRRPESEEIRLGAPNVPCDTQGPPWLVRYVTPERLSGEAAGAGESREGEKAPLPVSPELRERLEYVYPYLDRAQMPSKVTATELKGTYAAREAAEEAAELAGPEPPESVPPLKPPVRPAFMEGRRGLTPAQKGTATHIVMQFADYSKCLTPAGAAGEVERLRAFGTITDEQAAAVRPEIIADFFASQPGKLILGAEKLWRELKFSLLMDSADLPGFAPGEKVLFQGVVDCCVEQDGALIVIDFKTDRVTDDTLPDRAAVYKGQLDAYALAMERVLGMPVRRRILCFLTAGKWVEV